jgi:hypothetical protein
LIFRTYVDSIKPKGQARPIEERFLLRVDGQLKRSFSSKEPAATAGAVIKKAYPVVAVTVVDTEEHTTEIINAYRNRLGTPTRDGWRSRRRPPDL